ncbi:MAG: restriction endonuclease subunit S, partial [Candidatus Neomarinimicrobiota bacterium]
VELRKGLEHPCVLMGEVEPGKISDSGNEIKNFKGGAKFEKGDTLFAQITSCLENSKIAK